MKNLYPTILLFGISFMAMAQSSPLVHITIDAPIPVCEIGMCTTMYTEHLAPQATSVYEVQSIPYNPSFPFSGGTTLNASSDDVWSPIITLPFAFSFYGQTYNTLSVGSNGVITFDAVDNMSTGGCPWSFTQTIPNATFPIRNAIYGVYQDTNISSPPVTNPALQNVNYYVLDTGINAAPNRVFVVNFNELPQYQCGSNVGLQTSQIVLYEGTNIIDVIVKNRTTCATWNSGSGLIGIQNQAGTAAVVPSARNTGTWSATNEAWRFAPNGGESLATTFTWYINGILLPNETSDFLTACPTGNETYSVTMRVTNSDGSIITALSNSISDLLMPEPGFNAPMDLNVCTESPFVYSVNLAANTPIVMSSVAQPENYEIAYYDNLENAQNGTNDFIVEPFNYAFTESKTIYMSIWNVTTNCHYIKPFQITVVPVVTPPTGAPAQNFTEGETLADLNITGTNVVWYDAATEGNMLPSTTPLQDDTTYYATQIVSGCESNRNINATRLAVTVNLVPLANETFTAGIFSVYPNPVGDKLTITAKENLKSISIFNTIGQQIMHLTPDQKELHVNTSTLNRGVYFLKLDTQKESRTVKIIKN